MGYNEAREKLLEYRDSKISAMMGEMRSGWFTEMWKSISVMLKTFESSKENQTIVSMYSEEPSKKKVVGHVKLDYVCGLRREIRKQYVSEDDGICTDVTPFRHGIMSAHGAQMFDKTMAQVFDE